MANSLPGSPIVGYYNEQKEDFEEHNRIIDISNGKFQIKDTTRPYGFVDLNAKVWFQKFLDDDSVEREYLMTEGWLWTGQYKEAQRIIEKGNNQSMELSDEFLDATWTKDDNGNNKFFIINEAIIEKLCVLGEDVEPCFEGASIRSFSLSFDEEFKTQLFSMMKELKELIEKGGTPVFTKYAVEIGDALWSALYSYIERTYPDTEKEYYCSVYRIEGIYEENGQKFAILQDRRDTKYYRLDFALTEENGLTANENLVEVTKTYTPAAEPQFSQEAYEAYESEYAAKKKEEEKQGKTEQETKENSEEPTEGEKEKEEEEEKKKNFASETCPNCGKPLEECECEEKKQNYNLEEIPEYVALRENFEQLQNSFNELTEANKSLTSQIEELTSFKKAVEKKEKEALIAEFYMLSDADKQDVIDNIDTYSLGDIEAKLSIICVRNRVSFDDASTKPEVNTTYSLNGSDYEDTTTPAWIKAVRAVAKSMND